MTKSQVQLLKEVVWNESSENLARIRDNRSNMSPFPLPLWFVSLSLCHECDMLDSERLVYSNTEYISLCGGCLSSSSRSETHSSIWQQSVSSKCKETSQTDRQIEQCPLLEVLRNYHRRSTHQHTSFMSMVQRATCDLNADQSQCTMEYIHHWRNTKSVSVYTCILKLCQQIVKAFMLIKWIWIKGNCILM